MTALAARKEFTQTNPDYLDAVGLATNVIVYHGALMMKATAGTGYATPAAAGATTNTAIGVADLTENTNTAASGQAPVTPSLSTHKIDMTGVTAGTKTCQIRRGTFEFENKAGDLVTNQMIGLPVYVEDDQTVRATAALSFVAGTLMGFHPRTGKPMVEVGAGGRGL